MDKEIELIDLGDAAEETRQCSPMPWFYDSWFGLGTHAYPWPPDPSQCPM